MLLVAVPARAAWMVPPSPYKAKDFNIVKHDGWYHCFYIQAQVLAPIDSTERELGHAISRDLYIWTHLPQVLAVRPDKWDNAKIWAPHLLELDGVFYMLYTGVTNQPGAFAYHQRIGLATSTDLLTWNRFDEPVFSCAEVRWAVCDPLSYTGGEFRDAFVMPNVQGPGWIMLYTARPTSAPSTFVAGTAFSSGDLAQWVNGEPLWITHSSWSGTPVVESPHIFSHDGLYYLLFTGNGTQPLRLATGPDPLGGPATWTFRGTLGGMLGLNTAEWFASEYFRDGTHEYLCFANYDRVDIREIVWGPDWQFSLVQPPLFHVQKLDWSAPVVGAGEPVQLVIEGVNTFGSQVRLEAFEVDSGGARQAIPLSALGLPDSIPMTGSTTVFTWAARACPDPEEADANAEIVVRLTDQTAESSLLTITPSPWQAAGSWHGGDATPRVPREFMELSRALPRLGFRVLARSPLGGTALLVDLPAATPVQLDLFDLAGRRVCRLVDRTLPSGATVIPWDGRGSDGAPAPSGVYFARLEVPGSVRTARILRAP